jgi:hypothetical protein
VKERKGILCHNLFVAYGRLVDEIESTAHIGHSFPVIKMGDFAICNKGGRTTFSFRIPSTESINFTIPGEHDIKIGNIGSLQQK